MGGWGGQHEGIRGQFLDLSWVTRFRCACYHCTHSYRPLKGQHNGGLGAWARGLNSGLPLN